MILSKNDVVSHDVEFLSENLTVESPCTISAPDESNDESEDESKDRPIYDSIAVRPSPPLSESNENTNEDEEAITTTELGLVEQS